MPAPSFKGSYKMDDSFSSSDESGQDEGRARAAAEVPRANSNSVFNVSHLGEINLH